jgi:hypothetical protein
MMKKRIRRRYKRLVAGMTGAMLLSAAMMNHNVPVAKAQPSWENLVPDNFGSVVERSKENIERRVKDSIKESLRENIGKKIEEKKQEWGREILERLTMPMVSRANRVLEDMPIKFALGGTGSGSRLKPASVVAPEGLLPRNGKIYVEFADGSGIYGNVEVAAKNDDALTLTLSGRHIDKNMAKEAARVHILGGATETA